MRDAPIGMRQVMDWQAAFWAGLISGVIFYVFLVGLLPWLFGGSPWVLPRMTAAIILGEGALPPPADFNFLIVLVGFIIHMLLSLSLTITLAFIIHQWGWIVGIVGGAVFGTAVYLINFYTFTTFFPWFFALNGWTMLAGHAFFGALAGGVYEGLERDQFVEIRD